MMYVTESSIKVYEYLAQREVKTMPTQRKERLHKAFLLISLGIILYAVWLAMTYGGRIDFGVLRFFTILSNLLLGFSFFIRFALYGENSTFDTGLSFTALIAIIVTCLVSNFVLTPFGGASHIFAGYAPFVAHFMSGVLALINYFVFEQKGRFSRRFIPAAMAFPAIYWAIFVMPHSDFYPYFFMNPTQIGWFSTIIWFFVMLMVFAALSFGLVQLDSSDKIKQFPRKIVATALAGVGAIAVVLAIFLGGMDARALSYENYADAIEGRFLMSGDITEEGISVNPGISLYINMRGNGVWFRQHEGQDVRVALTGRNSHRHRYEPIYTFDGYLLRITDEWRIFGPRHLKNSSEPHGAITILVPIDAG